MLTNADKLHAANRAFRALFVQTLVATVTIYNKLSTVITDPAEEIDFGFMAELPGVREWIGDRVVQNLKRNGMTVRAKPFELTIGVPMKDIANDRLNIVKPRIMDGTQALAKHPDKLFNDLLMEGFNRPCYDGQYFFDTDHPVLQPDGTTVSVSNMGTAPFDPQGIALAAALAQMGSLMSEAGEPLEVGGTVLVVGPALADAARRAVKSSTIEGSSNPNQDIVEVVVSRRLAKYPKRWFVLDCSREIRPIVVQIKQAPQFIAKDQETDEAMFMRKQAVYGFDGEHNAAYGLWQLAWGSTGEGES
jgi:phage major head subunit gpT-like protein